MAPILDHVFICTTAGAPVAERLRQFGLTEEAPNRHTGQGTACRRFSFRNTMLELIWVEDAEEARDRADRRLHLWERWSGKDSGISPFGIILRPAAGSSAECPFESWEYRPPAMPDLCLRVAAGTGLEEPMWCYIEKGRAPSEVQHAAGFREITGVRVVAPVLKPASVTSRMAGIGVIDLGTGPQHLMELEFDGAVKGEHIDFRPHLPLVCRW